MRLRRPQPLFERLGDGSFAVRIGTDERSVLASLAEQLRALVTDGQDGGLRRLTPPAYTDDPDAEAEYRRMVGDDLTAARLARIDTFTATVRQEKVTESELAGWMGTLNDLRLVIGTNLDVGEETSYEDFEDDETVGAYGIYDYLSGLVALIVDVFEE
ncbi:MAG: DUF2017 family protein [Acidimicrobiia bacterium]